MVRKDKDGVECGVEIFHTLHEDQGQESTSGLVLIAWGNG